MYSWYTVGVMYDISKKTLILIWVGLLPIYIYGAWVMASAILINIPFYLWYPVLLPIYTIQWHFHNTPPTPNNPKRNFRYLVLGLLILAVGLFFLVLASGGF